jgi:large subunit ribosomal protein L4
MPKVPLYNVNGEEIGEVELSDKVFGAEIREDLMHKVVVAQLANRRQGTASTKTRAEVKGGGAKPWRQKGTGRARHGSIRSPIWRGGGIVFGPKPRSYRKKLPKKVKRLALKSALSSKVVENNLIVLDELKMERPKTKDMINILSNLNVKEKALLVLGEKDEKVILSARNIPGVSTGSVESMNVYDLLLHDKLILTKKALEKVEEVYS